MAIKTFTIQQEEDVEHVPFQIEFLPVDPEAEPRVETFEAYGKLPGGATMSMVALNRVDPRGKRVVDVSGLPNVLEKMMPPEQFARFQECIDDPDWVVDWDTILEIFNWLVEETSGRPTKRSPRSSRTRPVGGRTEHDAVIELHKDSVVETSSS